MVPSVYQKDIREEYGSEFYITSFKWSAPYVRLYPMPEWEIVEQRLRDGASLPNAEILSNIVNYYGQVANMDSRGRLLIPPTLREKAKIAGEVAVFGKFNRLDLWNEKEFTNMMDSKSLTDSELEELCRQLDI